jgi:hypothetical protein
LTSISLPAGIVIWTEYYAKSRMKLAEATKIWNIQAFTAWALGSLVIYYLYAIRGLWYGLLIGFFTTFLVYLVIPRK